MNTHYRIRYQDDDLFDDGRDFLLCSHDLLGVTLFLRRSVLALPEAENARVLEEAWAAYRELCDEEKIPAQRVYVAS